MTHLVAPFRAATSDDAVHMAELVNMAGDGLPLHLWAKSAAPGQTGWDVGLDRARRGLGGFAYHNTVVREEVGRIAACLIGYPRGAAPQPSAEEVPAALVPLSELGDRVPTTWYINILATYPEYRRRGFAAELVRIAEERARDSACDGISLIVSDANVGARRFYERNGFVERETRPIVKDGWAHSGQDWILLVKPL